MAFDDKFFGTKDAPVAVTFTSDFNQDMHAKSHAASTELYQEFKKSNNEIVAADGRPLVTKKTDFEPTRPDFQTQYNALYGRQINPRHGAAGGADKNIGNDGDLVSRDHYGQHKSIFDDDEEVYEGLEAKLHGEC